MSSSVQDELKAWARMSDEKPYEKKAEPNHPGSAADFLKSFEKSPVHPEPAAHTQPEAPLTIDVVLVGHAVQPTAPEALEY